MTIQKIKSLNELIELLEKDDNNYHTTLFLDIDDTLIKAKGEDCPNQIFRARMECGKELGEFKWYRNRFMSHYNPYYLNALRDYNRCAVNKKWEVTEPSVPKLIKLLNINQYHYYFLTARGVELHRVTKYWLSKHKLLPRPRNFMDNNRCENWPNQPGRSGIRGNIIYAGGYDKCQLLIDNKFKCHPIVIMVDDSLSNLQEFDNYFKNNKVVEFIGLHYDPSYIKEEIRTNGGW